MSRLLRAVALAVLLSAGTAWAAAAPPGAAACSGCHRPPGQGGAMASLQGRPAGEIRDAMRAYRAGERSPTVMDRIAKGFTDAEVDAIAGWFAGQG